VYSSELQKKTKAKPRRWDFLKSMQPWKELSLWNKIKYLNLNIFRTRCCKPLIFQTQIIWSTRIHSLKYLRSATFGSKDVVISKSEFFRAGSTFPVPVCTVPSSMDRTNRCNKDDAVRLYASYRLNLLLLKGQRDVHTVYTVQCIELEI